MAYNKTVWIDGQTALNADNLNHIENGVANAMTKDDLDIHLQKYVQKTDEQLLTGESNIKITKLFTDSNLGISGKFISSINVDEYTTAIAETISAYPSLDVLDANFKISSLKYIASGVYDTSPIFKLDFTNQTKYTWSFTVSSNNKIRHMGIYTENGKLICYKNALISFKSSILTKQSLVNDIIDLQFNFTSEYDISYFNNNYVFYINFTIQDSGKDLSKLINNKLVFIDKTETKNGETSFTIPNLRIDDLPTSKKLLTEQLLELYTELQLLKNKKNSNVNTLNLLNVDRVGVIGDSYTESHYTIKDKAWISKVSQFSDFNFENFAISGDTFRGQLNKIRNNANYYFGSNSNINYCFAKCQPSYTILNCRTNDIKYMDDIQFTYDLLAITETINNLGSIPIFTTEYHNGGNEGLVTLYKDLADRYNGYYIDTSSATYRNRGKDYASFWGGSHPGTRTNELEVTPVVKFFNTFLKRPYSAIKIFRSRTNQNTNLDDYLYNNIDERAKLFKEISISHSALTDYKVYDNCTNAANKKIQSEYLKLMNNEEIDLGKVALIEYIFPTDSKHLQTVEITNKFTTNVDAYILDCLSEPFPSTGFFRRFDIPLELKNNEVAIGDIFTSSLHLSSKYTVAQIIYTQVESSSGFVNGTALICSGDRTSSATNEGTLTKISGSGTASSLNYTYSSTALGPDYPAGEQKIGHWKKLNTNTILHDDLVKAMIYDKLPMLLISSTSIKTNDISCDWIGEITKSKDVHNKDNTMTFEQTNNFITNSSIVTIANTLNEIQPSDNCIPGINKDAKVYNLSKNAIKISINNANNLKNIENKKLVFGLQARYFPSIYTSGIGEPSLTENSFDYKTILLKVKYNNSSKYFIYNKLVGLHWQDVELELILTNKTDKIDIEILTNDTDIQITDQFYLY